MRRGWIGMGAAVLVLLAYHLGGAVTAAATRPAPLVTSVPTAEKVVALTFDDGPTPRWTPAILNLLKEEHVKATFFVIGRQVARYPHLVEQEVRDGMEIGSHGSQHLILRNRSEAAIRTEVEEAAQLIQVAGAPAPRLYRLPAGIYDRQALSVLGALGYTVIGWSVDPRDWRHRLTAEQMLSLVQKQVGPGGIIIFHDGTNGSQATVEATKLVIETLKKEGYRFLTVGQLLKVVNGRL
jgi:peptidoglycan/xylan/chitin deacetylase (PgdA/CDA1 family)